MNHEPLTPEEVQEAFRLCERATKEPWEARPTGVGKPETRSIVRPRPDLAEKYPPERYGDALREERVCMGWMMKPEDIEFIIKARTLLPRALATLLHPRPAYPKDGPCAFCGEPTSSIAGDPGFWPLWFTHPDGTGVVHPHHTRCVTQRLWSGPRE